MAYSITTRDGITIDNIPDNVPPDDPSLKARVAEIRRQQGSTYAPMGEPGDREPTPVPGAPALTQRLPTAPLPPESALGEQPPMAPPQYMGGPPAQVPPPPSGFFAGIREAMTGEARMTPTARALPEWTTMPELNSFSFESAITGLGTLTAGPEEIVRIVKVNFPGTQVFQDDRGNYVLRSSINNQDYVIRPGVTAGDIPRIAGAFAAFTPAGAARTVTGAMLGGGATEAALQAAQKAAGGEFDVGEVGMAALTGGAGPIVQRGAAAAAVPFAGARARIAARTQPPPGRPAEPPLYMRRPEPTLGGAPPAAPPVAPPAPSTAPPVTPAAAPVAPAGPMTFTGTISAEGVSDVLRLAQQASGTGRGAATARAILIDRAQLNPEAVEAAQRLGLDVPFDVFADNPQVRSAVGLTRARVGGAPEAAWERAVRDAVARADQIMQESDAIFFAGRPSTAVASQRVLDRLQATRQELERNADAIYKRIDDNIPKDTPVNLANLSQTMDTIVQELGGTASMTSAERRLYRMLEKSAEPDAPPITYGALLREKQDIGAALGRQPSPYANANQGALKRLYAALSSDQLENVGNVAGQEARRELRAANLMTAQRKALENRITAAFGNDLEGSIATKMQTAISTGAKGDNAAFTKLMRTVPEDLRRETLATALAAATASRRGAPAGGFVGDEAVFGFNDFVKTYRGLRSNEPLMTQAVQIMGLDWKRRMDDLYEISRRINDAQQRIPTTGKANQIINESTITGVVGQIMSNGIAQRVATAVTGAIPGGGALAPDLLGYMRNANTRGVEAASNLFTSPAFQQLAIEVATGTGTARADTMRRVALSRQFRQYADAIGLPRELDPRLRYLSQTIQTARTMAEQEQPQ